MSGDPAPMPNEFEPKAAAESAPEVAPTQEASAPAAPVENLAAPLDTAAPSQSAENDVPLFAQFARPPQERIPNLLHLLLLGLLALLGWLTSGIAALVAIHYHMYGVTTPQGAIADIHYTLGTEGLLYIVLLGGSLLLFPALWHKSLFAGLHWNGRAAQERTGMLVGAALACFVLAIVNGKLMPGPTDAPIDRLFRTPGAAWMLFAFGVTFAPFFEELIFRGFLLPALCTAFDWTVERATKRAAPPLDANGHPRWSVPAMVTSAVVVSLVFALLHAAQQGWAIGPYLLLVSVSLVLCWARLRTRSLAASVLVHACYNFMLFAIMLLGTGGFRHLDNM